jgi:transposase
MGEVSTIGIDIAKSVFQVHGVDTDGAVVIRKRVGRTNLNFFNRLATVPRWHGGVRNLSPLGTIA